MHMRYKIYVGHSRDERFDYLTQLYQPLREALPEDLIIVPHEGGKEAAFNSKNVIPTCDFMIAEVSYPSIGLGMELAWALASAVPVLCIHQADCQPSSSVTHCFSDVLGYEKVADMKDHVVQWRAEQTI